VPVPAAPAAPLSDDPPTPIVTTDQPSELELANRKIAELQAEQAAEKVQHESALAESRLQTVAAEAHKPSEKLNLGMQDAQLAQAIRVAKPVFWNQFTEAKQCSTLGVADTSNIKDSLVKRFFGPTSTSLESTRLAKNDPAQYKLLRLVAKLRHILG